MIAGKLANDEMERVAALLVADLGAKGVSLGYTPESLSTVDGILANYGHGKGNGDKNMGLVELVGAYFGEVLRRNLRGNWYENIPPDGATGLLLDEGSDFWVWCHSVVYKQLELGSKSLHQIYPDVVARLRELRA
jgi:hypothetical protein